MSFTFRPAKRENVGLIIGLSGPSGSGKTFSAMRLATGIAQYRKEKGFSLIDTENRRGLMYASKFTFNHVPISAPFEPKKYGIAMEAEDKAGSPVIVIDSMSHEWNGDGGILDWQEKELERLGGKDNVKMLSWVAPKGAHKRLVTRMLQVNAFLIPCLRAEPKIEMKKNAQGKMEVLEKKIAQVSYGGYVPVCEKNFPYELTVSFMLIPEKPGVPHPIKALPEELKAIFPLNKPLDEEAGYKIAEWASGGNPAPRQTEDSSEIDNPFVGKLTQIKKETVEGETIWHMHVGGQVFSTKKEEVFETARQLGKVVVDVSWDWRGAYKAITAIDPHIGSGVEGEEGDR